MRNNEYLTDENYAYFPELEMDESESGVSLLIRHDFYSSDNEHGQKLLNSLLMQYLDSNKKISNLFIVDSGVRLLDSENDYLVAVSDLLHIADEVFVCKDSVDYYGTLIEETPNMSMIDSNDFFALVINQKNLIQIN